MTVSIMIELSTDKHREQYTTQLKVNNTCLLIEYIHIT